VHDTSLPRRWNKSDNARLGLIGRKGASPCDDAFETSRQSLTVGRRRRCDVVRCSSIRGEKRGNALMFVRLEKPVGKSRKIEKVRSLVLSCLGPAAPLPQVSIRRPVRQFLPFSTGSVHRKVLHAYLRRQHRCHPRNLTQT
jgi:hypothetical protein